MTYRETTGSLMRRVNDLLWRGLDFVRGGERERERVPAPIAVALAAVVALPVFPVKDGTSHRGRKQKRKRKSGGELHGGIGQRLGSCSKRSRVER